MSVSKDFVVIHIPRTGGSSVASTLPKAGWHHKTALHQKTRLGDQAYDDCFSFAFVRNPWDRLYSIWKRGKSTNFRVVRDLSFEEYVKNFKSVEKSFIEESGRTWRDKDQVYFLCDQNNEIIVDYVGRFENLENDF